jgi:hypothetical protein
LSDTYDGIHGRIVTLTTGRINYGDIYAKSFYMLCRIHEQQGDSAKAIEHYEKFLDLWKDADPGIAEVEDARKRLAGLDLVKTSANRGEQKNQTLILCSTSLFSKVSGFKCCGSCGVGL